MKAKLARIGLFLFPITGLYCFVGVLQTIDFAGDPGYSPQRATLNMEIWGGGTLVSIIAFIICLIIYKRSAR
jgi:hypothetical protein